MSIDSWYGSHISESELAKSKYASQKRVITLQLNHEKERIFNRCWFKTNSFYDYNKMHKIVLSLSLKWPTWNFHISKDKIWFKFNKS